jgi:magnesium transporter
MSVFNGFFTLVKAALVKRDKVKLQELFDEIQPYDQAQILMALEADERKELFTYFTNRQLAEIIQEMNLEQQKSILEELGLLRSAQVFAEMSADDAADLLGELDESKQKEILHLMDDTEAADMRELLEYPENSAGGLMTTEYIVVPKYYTAEETVAKLRKLAPNAETVYYLYVVDEEEKLNGVLSLRDLIIANPDTRVQDIMYERVVSVPVHMDQEEVAKIMEKYDFLAIPVVDANQKLAGIITIDDAMDVIKVEATEDFTRMAAISSRGDSQDLKTDPLQAASKRIPWLVGLLFMGLLSGNIIAAFEETLETIIALAIFIPMIAGMAGNTGTQALAVVVRGLALGEIEKKDVPTLIKKEAGVGLIVGVVNGLVVALLAWIWQGLIIGVIVGITLWITLIVATLAGAVVPLVLHRLKIDPAVASGPFITTVNDAISLTIYFSIATLFMAYLI